MRTQIATVLSVAGVLAAGAGAYAVNSTVLSAPASSPIEVSTTLPNSNQAMVSPAAATPDDNAPASDAKTADITPQAQAVTSTTTSYQVGTAGSVVVDTSSGKIVVTSIAPASGWTSEPARTMSDGSVKVHFVSAAGRLEFKATMLNGKVSVSVERDDPINVSPLPAPAPPQYREHHDDDDDDHEEHEREDHEDEDDD